MTSAERLFQRCLQIRTDLLGRDNEQLTVPLDNLARIAQMRDDLGTAERLLREALAIDLRARRTDHPQYIRHLHRLAMVTYDKGNIVEAEKLYRQSVAAHQRILGAEHPETIDAMSSLGLFLMETNRLEEAQSFLQQSYDINHKLRPRHAYVGNDLENLGRLAFRRQHYAVAEQRFSEALAIYHDALPACHRLIAGALSMRGRTQLALNRPQAAQATLSEATECWRSTYGSNSAGYAIARASLGRALAMQRQYPQAEAALTESYPVLARSTQQLEREAAGMIRHWIEDLYDSTGRSDIASKYFAQFSAAALAAPAETDPARAPPAATKPDLP